jgi:actin-like ATPase involved in cell morphogenesis
MGGVFGRGQASVILTLNRAEPELAADIDENDIRMTGGISPS